MKIDAKNHRQLIKNNGRSTSSETLGQNEHIADPY
jgi:hypothetical protein